MDLNSASNSGPKPWNVRTTEHTTAPLSKSSLAVGTASMFNNAQNTVIAGGSFNITSTTNFNIVDGLDVLHKRVAPNAILNAGGRADKVRCHPGTRKEVIGRIDQWRGARDGQETPIFWLSGPAGAGKTAIVQTVAERCKAQGVPQANFFFFRADGSRSNASSLVATLLHQLILIYPSLRDPVASALFANPLILDSILEDQLAQLVIAPLQDIQQSYPSYCPLLILIDGLDECDSENKHNQRQILHAFDKVLAEHRCPFRLLVASRDESQIRAAFNETSSAILPLYLDSRYSPESDIRVYVIDQFKNVSKTHPLAHTLNATWPSDRDVDEIVKKSSGQFIYAATVMRFISDSSASPMLSLARVQGAARITAKSPFSHLDAIYTYILSQVDDQESLKDILPAQLLIQKASEFYQNRKLKSMNIISGMDTELVKLLRAYNPSYTQTVVASCLADLNPIAQYTMSSGLLFHHASFPDYLQHKSRSRNYFADIDAFIFKILPAAWKDLTFGLEATACYGLHRLKKLPPNFLSTLIALRPSTFHGLEDSVLKDAFTSIYRLCACDDDVVKYKQVIRQWVGTLGRSEMLMPFYYPESPPCSHRYLAMVRVQRGFIEGPTGEIAGALRPETDFDRRETALWLHKHLLYIHRRHYPRELLRYNLRLKEWICWAVWNDIPLDDLEIFPSARWYYWKSRTEKWAASLLNTGSCE